MPVNIGNHKAKLFVGNKKVKKVYAGDKKVYSAGNTVTYHVDNGITFVEEVDSDASCLSPTTFTPSKSGWIFVGWREDTKAFGNVLSSKIMGDDPLHLYALFRQTVTLTHYNNSTSAQKANGYRYSNQTNIADPVFTVSPAARDGWSFNGWCLSGGATAGISYGSVSNTAFSANATLYAKYSQNITLTAYNGSGSPTSYVGTRYYNSSGNTYNPSFTVNANALSGWNFDGWCTSAGATAGISYGAISGMQLSSNLTVYGRYSQPITLSYNGNGATGGSMGSQTGTRYFNSGNYSDPSFVLAGNGYSRTDWVFYKWALKGPNGDHYTIGSTVTLSSNTVFYAFWLPVMQGTFGYTGGIQTFTVPYTGTYLLQAWGAEGGMANAYPYNSSTSYRKMGGYGGYAAGYKFLTAGTVLYVGIGECPNGNNSLVNWKGNKNGGFNGGGNGSPDGDYSFSGGGGGATHIGLANGSLKDIAGNVLLAAGGGGGAGVRYASDDNGVDGGNGGAGGGLNGSAGEHGWYSAYPGGGGGTQSAAGNGYLSHTNGGFGFGASSTGEGTCSGGGGGGLYGGGCGNYRAGGGGGSGYIDGVTGGTMQTGIRSGHGYATIMLTQTV